MKDEGMVSSAPRPRILNKIVFPTQCLVLGKMRVAKMFNILFADVMS